MPEKVSRKSLPRAFYRRSAMQVARDLLGCRLQRRRDGEILSGRIVETEAYLGERDRASHAWRGDTPRTRVMFGAPGFVYVYFIYGMYEMFNVVCQPAGTAHAVLIRGIEPEEGITTMKSLRGGKSLHQLTNGPGKLCQALGITRELNAADLVHGELIWISRGSLRSGEKVRRSPRIGVDYAGVDASKLRRFFIAENPYVSKAARPAVKRQSKA